MLLAALALVCAACGSDEGDSASTGPASATTREAVELTGYLFHADGQTRICDAILESYPPQCGGEAHRVSGLDLSEVEDVREAQGVAWTERPVTLQGMVADGGTVVVTPKQGGPIEIPPPTSAEQPAPAPG